METLTMLGSEAMYSEAITKRYGNKAMYKTVSKTKK